MLRCCNNSLVFFFFLTVLSLRQLAKAFHGLYWQAFSVRKMDIVIAKIKQEIDLGIYFHWDKI